MADLEALRYRHDEMRRAVDIQRETVDALRARANVILVATLSVSAFLGVDAVDRAESAEVFMACAALLVTVTLFGAVLWTWKWSWYNKPEQLADPRYDDPRLTLEAFLLAGIEGMAQSSVSNEARLGKLAHLVVAEAIVAAITTMIWLVLAIP
jgi:hypothetical protein